jgi:GT2 family glycosyltransferase
VRGRARISAVVVSRNEGDELRLTVENLADTLPEGSEIVVVDDGSTDGSSRFLLRRRAPARLLRAKDLGVASARNLGARESRGDTIVFADAHIRLEPDWWRPLADLVEDPKVGGAAPAVNHIGPGHADGYGLRWKHPSLEVAWNVRRPARPVAAAVLPGCCFAMRRDVFQASGGWDEGMLQRGGVDNEGCVRLWLLGYELMVVGSVVVRHLFRARSPYPIGWPQYIHNRLRLAFTHFNPARLGKVVGALRGHTGFGEGLALLVAGDVTERRRSLLACRVRDDDWYFERFGVKW